MESPSSSSNASLGNATGGPRVRSILAHEDEPLWVAYTREFLLPGLMFIGMIYYLLFHVIIPMYHVGLPTRRPAESFATTGTEDEAEGETEPVAQDADAGADCAAEAASKKNK